MCWLARAKNWRTVWGRTSRTALSSLTASWSPRDTSWHGDDQVQMEFFAKLTDSQVGRE